MVVYLLYSRNSSLLYLSPPSWSMRAEASELLALKNIIAHTLSSYFCFQEVEHHLYIHFSKYQIFFGLAKTRTIRLRNKKNILGRENKDETCPHIYIYTLKACLALQPMNCKVLCSIERVYWKDAFSIPSSFSWSTAIYSNFVLSILLIPSIKAWSKIQLRIVNEQIIWASTDSSKLDFEQKSSLISLRTEFNELLIQ